MDECLPWRRRGVIERRLSLDADGSADLEAAVQVGEGQRHFGHRRLDRHLLRRRHHRHCNDAFRGVGGPLGYEDRLRECLRLPPE